MPVNPDAKLVPNLFDEKLEKKAIRDGWGDGLVKAGEENKNVVVLCADLTESTRSLAFQQKFPERFVEIGVAEQNMASLAAGFALAGKIPYISSYAMFSPGRNWEQIRTTIGYNEVNVKIGGAHAGISVGPDGATHQAVEDIAITRVLPNMTVLVPCDAAEAKKVTYTASKIIGPVYMRFAREKTFLFTTEETPFEVGKAFAFWNEKDPNKLDVAIIACGPLVYNALKAADSLEKEGVSIRVINTVSVKPIDEIAILEAAKKAGCVVTVEEHQVNGGMGSAVAEVLSRNYPVPIEFIGVQNRYGESGEPDQLVEKFGMGTTHIIEAAKKAIARK